ncbi:hypothetical protein Tco_1194835 [Tanacetum coccineum]
MATDHRDQCESSITTTITYISPINRLLPLPTSSISRRADIPEADIPPWKRLLHLGLRLGRALLLLLDSRDLLWPVGSIIVLWILWMPVSELQRGGLWFP